MDIDAPLALLGGLSPRRFMRTHWQRKPLLVRQAVAGLAPALDRRALFALAARDDVESRLVRQGPAGWSLRRGAPLPRSSLPAVRTPRWTLLVQGADVHDEALHGLLQQFRFVPDARLDDLMVSWASDGGGVGPHFDSYDVFLLQAQGRRRWRIGRQRDLRLRDDVPLKILARFVHEQEFVLEPGDMLYLPPRWAHDGVAVGECMTYSIGFRAPGRDELARELLQRVAEGAADPERTGPLYADAGQPAALRPGELPPALQDFARAAVARALADPVALPLALGEYLTEPKAAVWFEAGAAPRPGQLLRLDRRSRMLYDEQHVYLNGEAYRARGRDARLMRRLADERMLPAPAWQGASAGARALLVQWCRAGWLQAVAAPVPSAKRSVR